MTGIKLRMRARDMTAEALQDPRTTIVADGFGVKGAIEYASAECDPESGEVTVQASIAGSNVLGFAGVELTYRPDDTVNARQITPNANVPYMEINIADDGTAMPAIYHGKNGTEIIG